MMDSAHLIHSSELMGFAQGWCISSLHNDFPIKPLSNTNFSGDCIQLHILDVKEMRKLTFFLFYIIYVVLDICAQTLF